MASEDGDIVKDANRQSVGAKGPGDEIKDKRTPREDGVTDVDKQSRTVEDTNP